MQSKQLSEINKNGAQLEDFFLHLSLSGSMSQIPNANGFGDEKIKSLSDGYLIGQITMDFDWDHCEMHRYQDELIFILNGSLLLKYDDVVKADVCLLKGQIEIIPKGYWHTADIRADKNSIYDLS